MQWSEEKFISAQLRPSQSENMVQTHPLSGLGKHRLALFGTATMSKAAWICVFVFLTSAVPLQHTNTSVSSTLKHTPSKTHDATGQGILIDDDTFIQLTGLLNSSHFSSSNSSTKGSHSLSSLMGSGRKKRHVVSDYMLRYHQPVSLNVISNGQVENAPKEFKYKINDKLKRVEKEADFENGEMQYMANSIRRDKSRDTTNTNGGSKDQQERPSENHRLLEDYATGGEVNNELSSTQEYQPFNAADKTREKLPDCKNTNVAVSTIDKIEEVATDNIVDNLAKINLDYTLDSTLDETTDSNLDYAYNSISSNTDDQLFRNTKARLSEPLKESTDRASSNIEDNVSNSNARQSDHSGDRTRKKRADQTERTLRGNIHVSPERLLKMKIVELPPSPSNNKTDLEQYMTCEHVPSFYTPRWLSMVTECPPTWANHKVRQQCLAQRNSHTLSLLELLVSLPVQDSQGNVYANEYCARCQGVPSYQPWTAEVVCKPTADMPVIPKSKLEFPEFNRQLSSYFAGPDCERKIQPAIPSGIQDCKTGRLMQGYHPFMAGRFTRTNTGSPSPGNGIPFTILFNFDFTGRKNLMFEVSTRVEQERTTGFRCRAWETYDPHIKDCRQVNCSRNYVLVDNKCVQDSKDDNSDKYTITSLKELNFVQQATKVSIRMNVSVSETEAESSNMERYKSDLAGILQVGVERMENFNISFTPGSIPHAIFSYDVLTKERYQELFPRLPDETENYDDGQPKGTESASDIDLKARTAADDSDEENPDAGNRLASGDEEDTGNTISNRKSGSNALGNHQNDTESSTYQDNTTGSAFAPDSTDTSTDAFRSQPKDSTNYSQGDTQRSKNDSAPTETMDRETVPIPSDVRQPMVMQIDFVLVPQHNRSDGDSRKLMRRIQELNHRFIIQMADGDIKFKETPLPEDFADTTQFCPWGIEHKLESEEFIVLEDTDGNLMLYVNKTNQYLKMGRFDLFIKMAGDDAADLTNVREEAEFAFGCFMPRINQRNCIRISLKSEEYEIQGDQKNLLFEGHIYDVFSYYVSNETTGEVQICMPNSFNKRVLVSKSKWYAVVESCGSSFLRVQQAEAMITDILGRVSLVALCVVLITYLLFPRLRNLPGINTMNLTFALLVAETMFSHGIDAKLPWLCTAVAVSLHYLFLAAHFWMNVMSYDVYRTFVGDVSGSMPMKRVKDKKKYVPLYSLYAWGTPLIIVAFCVLVDKSDLISGVNTGYGVSSTGGPNVPASDTNSSFANGTASFYDSDSSLRVPEPTAPNHPDNTTGATQDTSSTKKSVVHGPSQLSYCWITQPLAAFISFGAPILIIFTANCIFFARVITTISRTARLSKTRLHITSSTSSLNRKQPGRSDAVLYLRMSTVMGFTWIFGLSSSIVSSFSRPAFEICVISHVLGILFTIFNISQGIFIFGAFVCNRRVWNLYRALFTRMRTAVSERGSRATIYVVNSTTTLTTLSEGVTLRQ